MKTNWIKNLVLAGAMLLGVVGLSAPAAAQPRFSVGIGIGTPGFYAPAPVVAYRHPYPGPGYSWVDGFYNPYGVWTAGYWAAPRPVVRPYGYVAPRVYGGFYGGVRGGFVHRDFRGGFRGRR
jgi:hypothetical protein